MEPGQALALAQTTLPASAQNDGLAWQRDRAEDIARRYRALSRAFSVIRPASFSDAAVGDWLDAAVELTEDIELTVLEAAAREAANTCQYHSKILPTIRERAAEVIAARERSRRLAAPLLPFEGWGAEPLPPKLHLSPEEVAEIKAAAAAMWRREQEEQRQRRSQEINP
jgi:hypothetical protein